MGKTTKISIFSLVFLAASFYCATILATQAPVANAGPDLYVNSGQTIILQGSGNDADGGTLTYYWNCSGGTLSSYNAAQPTYTAPSVNQYNNQTTYTCTLAVTDNAGLSSSDSMIVYANYNQTGSASVQTNSAANISNYQATLNGYLTAPYITGSNYVWFQWGTTTSYGSETTHQNQNSGGAFSQNIVNLSANTTYHFRAAAQIAGNTVYGQDMTFYTSSSGTGSGALLISKKVINISSGNLNWSTSVNAKPSDVLSFVITLQANGNQDIHNVYVRDVLPANLIYKDNLMLNTTLNYSGDPVSGINIGTISAGNVAVLSYRVQVANYSNLAYGTSVLTNSATITSAEAGSQTTSATVFVNNSLVYGATNISTGLTNDFLTESFFLPMFLIVLASWFYFSGKAYKVADWLKTKKV